MALIGELNVNLVANTKKLVDGFKKASKASKKFVSSSIATFKKYQTSISNIAGGVGAGTIGLGLLIARQTEAQASQIRFAESLGLTIKELESYHAAARSVGVSQDAMNDGLRELSKRASEALTGTGSMKDALEAMGIEAEDFSKKKLGEQFKIISDSLKDMTESARNFQQDEIFGGTFADNATGLTAQIQEGAAAWRELNAGTGEEASKKILTLDSNIKDLTASVSRLTKDFLIDISGPAIETVKQLRGLMEAAGIIDIGQGEKGRGKQQARDAAGIGRDSSVAGFMNQFRKDFYQEAGEFLIAPFMTEGFITGSGSQLTPEQRARESRAETTPEDVADRSRAEQTAILQAIEANTSGDAL